MPWDVLLENIQLFHDPLLSLWKRFNLMAANDRERYRTRLNALETSMWGMALRIAAEPSERTNSRDPPPEAIVDLAPADDEFGYPPRRREPPALFVNCHSSSPARGQMISTVFHKAHEPGRDS